MIRVLIVDDSPFFRKILKDILEKDEDIAVVGEAKNGKEVLGQIALLRPDLVTLDIEMPVMDGIAALRQIIENYNIPVVMLSGFSDESELTLKALEIGAVDFIQKPKNIFSLQEQKIKSQITEKIKVVAKSNLKTNKYIANKRDIVSKDSNTLKTNDSNFKYLITIGTSTGGPRALQEVIPMIPKDINGCILVVQHMPPNFTKSLADRLNRISEINVKEGEDGDILKRGWCYIAPGDYHMRIAKKDDNYIVKLDKGPAVKGLRPSVDILMESVALVSDLEKIGVIMTGMGSDGAKGIVQIKKTNGYIICQDEESSTVFGMPKAAINTNCVDIVVPLNCIADEIIRKMGV